MDSIPLWLSDDSVHDRARGRVGQTPPLVVEHPTVDPLLHHHYRKLGPEGGGGRIGGW